MKCGVERYMSIIKSLAEPVEPRSVSRSRLVLERIKEALINKELKPGDYLPSESELVKNLGVGKSSVREAVKMLEAMGVVEVKRGNGTIIRESPDSDSVNSLVFQLILQQGNSTDVLDLRIMIETAATIMAMDRATDEDFKRIEETIVKFEEDINKGIHNVQDDMMFHYAILESTHNPFVIRIGDTINQLFKYSIGKSVRETPQIALSDHKKIFKAFGQKDEARVRKAILDSLERWKTNID